MRAEEGQSPAAVVRFVPRARSAGLARLGEALARHRRAIAVVQWAVVLVYAVLVAVPAFLPLPQASASMVNNLTLAAQFAFWGLWWPGVILATMLLGRIWCGVLCPEGALAEFASRHGRAGPIPRWVRWRGWPLLAFVATTVYGQLVSVYEYPQAALLVLGGSTVAAVVVGLAYGRGKRVWCRYLCPVSGVFALLARVAPLHYRVDRAAWAAYPLRTAAVDCAPLLPVQQMTGAAQCHACGRCAGHRDAVSLSARSPAAEILASGPRDMGRAEAWLLIWGLFGVAIGAFRWSSDARFVAWRQHGAAWLAEREWWALLDTNAPWWLLTHYPAVGDAFTWLDGLLIPAYIGATALLIGGFLQAGAWLAGRLSRLPWTVLAATWIPAAGAGLFVGLTLLTQTQLRAEGIYLPWLDTARTVVLCGAFAVALVLGAMRLVRERVPPVRAVLAWLALAAPLALVGAAWWQQLFRT
jgi:polyferredoxin